MVDYDSLLLETPEQVVSEVKAEGPAEHGKKEAPRQNSCSSNCKVRVGVRIRPLESPKDHGAKHVVFARGRSISIGKKQFTYDMVFDSNSSQELLYERVKGQLLGVFLDGYNATIMAYGQTGSGKTYAMGSDSHHHLHLLKYGGSFAEECKTNLKEVHGWESYGLIPRFIADIFAALEQQQSSNDCSSKKHSFHLTASFQEVYGEDVYDLLNPSSGGRKSLPIREDSSGAVTVVGLNHVPIFTVSDALSVLHQGSLHRKTAATSMNQCSSRSHAIFTIELHYTTGCDSKTGHPTDVMPSTSDVVASSSKFTFVDLAGSERMKKTGAEGERAREGIKINEGLLALGNVIHALSDEERQSKANKATHIPYRQSKLTRLLQDALGGNSQTLFLACVSPSGVHVHETLSTLYYANRARNIRNVPTKNLDRRTVELLRLHAWTKVLQFELVKHRYGCHSLPLSSIDGRGQATQAVSVSSIVMNEIMHRQDVQQYLESLYQKATLEHSHHGLSVVKFSKKVTLTKHNVNTSQENVIELDSKQKTMERYAQHEAEEKNADALQVHHSLSIESCCSIKQQHDALLEKVQRLEAEKLFLAEQLKMALRDSSSKSATSIQTKISTWTSSIILLILDTLNQKGKNKFWRVAYHFFKTR